MKFNKFKKLVALAMSASLLSGITAQFAPAIAHAEEKPVTIKFWNFPNFTSDSEFKTPEEYDKALIEAFQKKYPHIKVEYQKLDFTDGPAKVETALQSQTNPDVIYDAPGRIIDWASKGYLAPFKDVDTSKLNESAVKASSFDGDLYLYPQGIAPFLMAVNTEVTDKLGVTDLLPLKSEDRNWTVEEFQKFLEAVQEKDPDMIPTVLYSKSAAGDQGPRAFVSNLFGSWITNDDVTEYTINNEAGVKAMEWIKEQAPKGIIGQGAALEAKDALEYFKSGKAALTILASPGLLAQWKDTEGLNARFLPFPNVDKSPKYEYLVAGPAVFDNGDDAKIKAAQQFVDFMINDEEWGIRTLKATGNFSAKKDDTGLYDDEELAFAEKLSDHFGAYYNTIPGYARMRPLWFPLLQGVLSGDTENVKEALDAFVKEATDIYKEEAALLSE
ncbi:extracellular solute-binding protein [Tuanshanicoccus lijuaniae]|uniref:ABC transporter substrate-binding protein n=1 Tax=Aerococcaceae bacterium zg-1292 TaxID=2774330 RepID=UPI0019379434|nr:extracellular solute-binding protein [Aerococcaceae bacterium zg-1292]MBF6626672.1 extracellular solute-binding protein [Aerococcaceae bacterium zg-BR9]MBF6977617.1 extracellular solute-binding protein [Aerococcaceae bacterium zg-BR22]QQA36515.1 extracellular solute-binding protein [Aerococcaceae bacterium zg-1292]